MSVILIPVCFISIFFGLGILAILPSKKEIFIFSVLVFSVLILFGTELLSSFHALNYAGILIYWIIITLGAGGYLYSRRDRLSAFITSFRQKAASYLDGLNLYEKIFAGILFILLALIFIQGIMYPPTNFDSMTYHLARITSWISHGAVSYYPTDLTRQIYQPPFA